jgi:hypothetical protein
MQEEQRRAAPRGRDMDAHAGRSDEAALDLRKSARHARTGISVANERYQSMLGRASPPRMNVTGGRDG